MSSKNLSYLYPITRVRSIVQLLKTTSHSGFLIVHPCKASSIRTVPKSVKKAIPQLYARESMIMSDGRHSVYSEHLSPSSPIAIAKEAEDEDCYDDCRGEVASSHSLDENNDDICRSYTLPAHRKCEIFFFFLLQNTQLHRTEIQSTKKTA